MMIVTRVQIAEMSGNRGASALSPRVRDEDERLFVVLVGSVSSSATVTRTPQMTTQDGVSSRWAKLRNSLLAIGSGLLIALVPANVWPLLLINLGVPLAAIIEAIFLGLYLWWASGGGPPRTMQATRVRAFRRGALSPTEWFWGLIGAFFFAATIHASIALLFRFVPFPMAAFRHGYDFSFIPSPSLRWLAVVVSATPAGICERAGFRGYRQGPYDT